MKKLCMDCNHFIQHFIKKGRGYQKICFGHCVSKFMKRRQAGDKICEHFIDK